MSPNRVLIFDDDLRICSFVSRIAKSQGYETCAVQQPQGFADSYFAFAPTLIMLDLQLERQSSADALQFLAAQKARAPVVLMSGLQRDVIEHAGALGRSLRLNMAGVCAKPFERELLTNLFNRHYQRPTTAAATPSRAEVIQALQGGAISVYYQPIHSLERRKNAAVELLARWRNEDDDMRRPHDFLRFIERYDLAEEFTLHVLKAGLDQALPWLTGDEALKAAVNVTLGLLRQGDFTVSLEAMLGQRGLAPAHIMLEIQDLTAADGLGDLGDYSDMLADLQRRGFTLIADGLDEGAAALIAQQQLPITRAKIDYTALPPAEEDIGQDNAQPARQADRVNNGGDSPLAIAQELGLACCIKGIDSKIKFAHAQQLDIAFIQGYYISKPLPAAAISAWI